MMTTILAKNCIITRGYNRSLLCDLLRFKWWAIPNEIATLLENELFSEIQRDYTDFYDLLIEEDVLVSIPKNDVSLFPKFDLKYESPSLIEHAIIDWDQSISHYNILDAINELAGVGCRNLSMRFYGDFNHEILSQIFEGIYHSTVEATELMVSFQMLDLHYEFFASLKNSNTRFIGLTVYSCPALIPNQFRSNDWIIFTTEKISDCSSCGKISPLYFCLNIPHYTLTKNYNNCLYKKIGIDIDGQIKNCPSSFKGFGAINEICLKEVVFDDEFLKIGRIKKDDVKVCSDCEFRSICSDCRIYIDNPKDLHSRPAKCDYNPYIAKWKNEDGYVSLGDSGVYVCSEKLNIDHDRIAAINKRIWEE